MNRERVVATSLRIPDGLRAEHQELHARVVRAARQAGAVGDAGRALLTVLEEHMVKEDSFALPPLGLLAHLATRPLTPEMADAIPLTETLKERLPELLEEHAAIAEGLRTFRKAAAGRTEYADLADHLLAHVQMEEEVLYPAALLVGEYLKSRLRS
jgi:iron-sulfur cluster repair protein YtfE (RIC family)